MTSIATLVRLNAFAFVCHLISGVLGVILAKQSNPAVYAYAPLVEFSSNTTAGVFTPTPKQIFKTGAFTGLILFAFITAGFHIIYIMILLSPSLDAFIRRRLVDSSSLMPLRWVEYGITATIISAWGQLSIGNDSFYFFLTMLTSGFSFQFFGLLLEKLDCFNKKDRNIAEVIWNIASLINISPVAILLYQLFASRTHNQQIFIYNIAPYALWFQSFGVIAWLTFIRYHQFKDRAFSEKWYLVLSLSTKLTIFWLGFSTFREISVKQGWVAATPGVDWYRVRMTAAYLPFGLVFFVALNDAMDWWRQNPTVVNAPVRQYILEEEPVTRRSRSQRPALREFSL